MNPQEIDELFARTLSGGYEDDLPWEAVRELRHLGTREVFDRAVEWCRSADPLARSRGADVLSQLGQTVEHPTNGFPEESFLAVSQLLHNENDPRPLSSAIAALGHINNPRAIPLIAQYCGHPSTEVRFSVACALGSFALLDDSRAIEALLILMKDNEDDVRDWATFGLGVLGDLDSHEIREALLLRINDSNEDVREEAMVGLSKRNDPRILPFLLTALEQATMTDRVREGAYLMLKMDKDRTDWNGHDYAMALRRRFSL